MTFWGYGNDVRTRCSFVPVGIMAFRRLEPVELQYFPTLAIYIYILDIKVVRHKSGMAGMLSAALCLECIMSEWSAISSCHS